MTISRRPISKAIAVSVLGMGLIATATPASTQPFFEGGHGPRFHKAHMSEPDRAQKHARMQEHMLKRLDRLGARLEIKASQQQAWAAFRNSVGAMIQDIPQHPARDADAATLMRHRADMAQRAAQRLATLAEATASLQQALEPDQRKVLDETARNFGTRGLHRRHGRPGFGFRGGHGNHERQGDHDGHHRGSHLALDAEK